MASAKEAAIILMNGVLFSMEESLSIGKDGEYKLDNWREWLQNEIQSGYPGYKLTDKRFEKIKEAFELEVQRWKKSKSTYMTNKGYKTFYVKEDK